MKRACVLALGFCLLATGTTLAWPVEEEEDFKWFRWSPKQGHIVWTPIAGSTDQQEVQASGQFLAEVGKTASIEALVVRSPNSSGGWVRKTYKVDKVSSDPYPVDQTLYTFGSTGKDITTEVKQTWTKGTKLKLAFEIKYMGEAAEYGEKEVTVGTSQ